MRNSEEKPAASEILVVEDERDIAGLIAYQLTKSGYSTRTVADGEQALEAVARERPDLIVLDLMLPGVPGYDVLKELRRREDTARVPVVVLTARREEDDRIKGLELGADDYVTKPFSPTELVLRIAAVLRRTRSSPVGGSGRLLRGGPVAVDMEALRVTIDNEEVDLTPTEFRLLTTLLERQGRVQSRKELLRTVWEIGVDMETRRVDIHVQRLRDKLGGAGAWIETARGFGYRFRLQPPRS